MSWNYAKLSQLAKEAGGPEALIAKLKKEGILIGKTQGRKEMISFVGVGIGIGALIKTLIDYYADKKNISSEEAKMIETEIIEGINNYNLSHPNNRLEGETGEKKSKDKMEYIKQESEKKIMCPKFKVKMIYSDGEEEILREIGSYNDAIFESEEDAEAAGLEACSETRVGAETLHMSNPGDHPYDEDDFDVDYEVIEID